MIHSMKTKEIIKKIKKSGLCGRGGAAFPTGLKWEIFNKAAGKKKYIICNGSEGELKVFKDKFIIENYPEEIIKGIEIALSSLGAQKAYFYLKKKYYQEYKNTLKQIIQEKKLPIEIFQKTGGYLCGEETTLIESIEKKRLEPRKKPPYPIKKGLWGCPTLVNNVETFYSVSQIIQDKYKRTRFYTLSGVKNSGVYELLENLSIKEILKKTNNYPKFKFFIQMGGGASGEILLEKELNKKVNGVGAIIVYPFDKVNPFLLMQKWIKFFYQENCGKCLPCREGIYRLREILKSKNSFNKKSAEDLLFVLDKTAFCPFGKSAANPFVSLIKKVVLNNEKE